MNIRSPPLYVLKVLKYLIWATQWLADVQVSIPHHHHILMPEILLNNSRLNPDIHGYMKDMPNNC